MNSFVFNSAVPGSFTAMTNNQNLASPPETPQAQLGVQGSGWPEPADVRDRQWAYEVPDEPLYTPAHENFNLEIQCPQPQYIANMSQPVTPAFGQFNSAILFGHDGGSPQFKSEPPQYTLNTQNNTEYSFPDAQGQYPLMFPSPMSKQKTFQFSNTTAADFSEK
jgi:hypothetical protein